MKYIRQIHVVGTDRSAAAISRIRYSYTLSGPLYEEKSSDAVRAIELHRGDYSVLDASGRPRPVAVRMTRRGIKCISTVETDTQDDAILSLETF